MFTVSIITPHAHARSGVKQSVCLSVVCLSVCQAKKIEISPHKPSKWGQTIANSKKLLYVYLTEVKALRFAVFRLFPTFITIHNIGSTSSWPSRTGHAVHLETSWFEMTARKQCFLTIYVLHRHHGYCFGCFFQLFPIIRNIWPHLSSFTICCIYGKRSLPHLGYVYIRDRRPVRCASAGRDVTSIVAALHAFWPVDVQRGVSMNTSSCVSDYIPYFDAFEITRKVAVDDG